jgi:hypothetical protein
LHKQKYWDKGYIYLVTIVKQMFVIYAVPGWKTVYIVSMSNSSSWGDHCKLTDMGTDIIYSPSQFASI